MSSGIIGREVISWIVTLFSSQFSMVLQPLELLLVIHRTCTQSPTTINRSPESAGVDNYIINHNITCSQRRNHNNLAIL
jgi:hypothetical protein